MWEFQSIVHVSFFTFKICCGRKIHHWRPLQSGSQLFSLQKNNLRNNGKKKKTLLRKDHSKRHARNITPIKSQSRMNNLASSIAEENRPNATRLMRIDRKSHSNGDVLKLSTTNACWWNSKANAEIANKISAAVSSFDLSTLRSENFLGGESLSVPVSFMSKRSTKQDKNARKNQLHCARTSLYLHKRLPRETSSIHAFKMPSWRASWAVELPKKLPSKSVAVRGRVCIHYFTARTTFDALYRMILC